MARKHFDTLFISGSVFNVHAPAQTPTGLGSRSFRLTRRPSRREALWIFVGFGNSAKHAGDSTPSADPSEAVPCGDPTRSGKALRDGWQPVAIIDRDKRDAAFVTGHSVNDERFVSHVAALLSGRGYRLTGMPYAVTLFGASEHPTTLSHSGAPRSTTFRNTEANAATKRASVGGGFMARDGGSNPLLDWRE